jgi:hypothetical protein
MASDLVIYADEVAAHLWEMSVGETRLILHYQGGPHTTNMLNLLERRGWFIGRHFQTCLTKTSEGVRRRMLRKLGQPAAYKKLKPVDTPVD